MIRNRNTPANIHTPDSDFFAAGMSDIDAGRGGVTPGTGVAATTGGGGAATFALAGALRYGLVCPRPGTVLGRTGGVCVYSTGAVPDDGGIAPPTRPVEAPGGSIPGGTVAV